MLWLALAFIVIGALLLNKGKKESDSTLRTIGIILIVLGIVFVIISVLILVFGFSILNTTLENANMAIQNDW